MTSGLPSTGLRPANADPSGKNGRMGRGGVPGCGEEFLGNLALPPLEAPALLAAAQLAGGHGAKLLLDVVEVGLQLGHGTRRERRHARHVRHVDDLDAAGPALQQVDRGVQRPDGGRGSVITNDEPQICRRRRPGAHAGSIAGVRMHGVPGMWLPVRD
jgi:hypothetical protein